VIKPSSNLFPFIGRAVKDEYGREVGRIASFLITPNGRVDEVLVEQGDGEFLRYSTDRFKTHDDGITLLPPVKLQARALCNEIPLIWRKDQALSDLLEKKKISPEVFEGLHRSFEGALTQLKTDAKTILDDIDEQVTKRTQQIKDLHSALVNLEIEREIGRVDDQAYQTAMQIIQKGLERANGEDRSRSHAEQTFQHTLRRRNSWRDSRNGGWTREGEERSSRGQSCRGVPILRAPGTSSRSSREKC
jgi:hypothetical protein